MSAQSVLATPLYRSWPSDANWFDLLLISETDRPSMPPSVFHALDLTCIACGVKPPRMADLRNVYSAQDARNAGFKAYSSIGRPDMTR